MQNISQKQSSDINNSGVESNSPLITKGVENEMPDPLSRIEGLDLDVGLYLAAHNRELYEMILKSFVANNRTSVAKIRQALSANDVATASRIVHSLKGTAGTIGAVSLQKAAKAAESSIGNKQPEVAFEEIQSIQDLIEPLLRELHHALALEPED